MTDAPAIPRPALPATKAPRRTRPAPRVQPRAPFLPKEPHPHGWLTTHQAQPHTLMTDKTDGK